MTVQTWVEGAAGSGFDIDHLPFGVFARSGEHPRVAVRIGDQVLDLSVVAAAEMVDTHALFDQPTLNPFMAAGPEAWASTRAWITGLLTSEAERDVVEPALSPVDSVTMLLPFGVGDYVDFYASEHHASNVGRIFRPDSEPLLPNWKNLPVGYHGRSGTVVVSGTDVVRPSGQRKAPTDERPTYGPAQRLDIEAELGFVVGVPSTMGERVATADFARHTFGVVGLNDWSARDIQAWEYVPLGPFLAKSFATSISAWVTPLAALDAAWTELPGQARTTRRSSTTCASTARPGSTSMWRWCSTARSWPGRPTARCTGRRPRCSPTRRSTARASAPATCGRRARSRASSATSAARSSSSAGAARSRSPRRGASGPSSRTATR